MNRYVVTRLRVRVTRVRVAVSALRGPASRSRSTVAAWRRPGCSPCHRERTFLSRVTASLQQALMSVSGSRRIIRVLKEPALQRTDPPDSCRFRPVETENIKNAQVPMDRSHDVAAVNAFPSSRDVFPIALARGRKDPFPGIAEDEPSGVEELVDGLGRQLGFDEVTEIQGGVATRPDHAPLVFACARLPVERYPYRARGCPYEQE